MITRHNLDNNFLLRCLRPEYQSFARIVREKVQSKIWENPLYQHCTRHNAEVGDQLLEILSSFVERFQGQPALNEIEYLLLALSAYLYDIGLQARKLDVLGLNKETDISALELELIRRKRAALTVDMIQKSGSHSENYPHLGLPDDEDGNELRQALAMICSSQEYSDLASLPADAMPYHRQVRIRLLATLLYLGNQLFLSTRRINVQELRENLEMPVAERTILWLNYYVQGIFIDTNDQIRIIFNIPEEHAELNEVIRGILVDGVCTQVQERLWELQVKTLVSNRIKIENMPKGTHNKELLPEDIRTYLSSNVTKLSDNVVMFIDFEAIRVFLGRHSLFEIDTKQIIEKMIMAAKPYGLLIKTFIYADWERYDDDASKLNWLRTQEGFSSIELVFQNHTSSPIVQRIAEDAQKNAFENSKNLTTVMVCGHSGLEDTIGILQQTGSVVIWEAGNTSEKTYKPLATAYMSVDNLMGVSLQNQIAAQIERIILQLIAVMLDSEMTRRQWESMLFRQISRLVEQHSQSYSAFKWGSWWTNFCIFQGIIQPAETKLENLQLYQMNKLNSVVQEALELRDKVLETLEAITTTTPNVTLYQLDRALKENRSFSNDTGRHLWLDVLQKNGLIVTATNISTDEVDLPIKIDPTSQTYLAGRQHLDRLVIAVDDLLNENPTYSWQKPWVVKNRLQKAPSPSLSERVVNATFKTADKMGLVHFEEKDDGSGKKHYRLFLNYQHPRVMEYLTSRDTCVFVLHDWCRMNRQITLQRFIGLLREYNFGESDAFRLKWVNILVDEGLMKPLSDQTEKNEPFFTLDDENLAVQSILSPHYILWLINLVKEYRPNEKYRYPGPGYVVERLTRQSKSRPIAQATLNSAKRERLLVIKNLPGSNPSGSISAVELTSKHEGILAKVEQQHPLITKRMVEILVNQSKDWLSIHVLLNTLRPFREFGVLDVERFDWINRMVSQEILKIDTRKRPNGQSFQVYRLNL